MNRPSGALVFAVILLTAACGGTATASKSTDSPSQAPSTSPASASTATDSTSPSAASGGDGSALCAFLTSEIPKLKQAGSTGGAVGELAIDYSNWIEADSSRVLPDAAAMDTLTEASCPETRTNVLKLIGSDSFATGF